LLNENGNYRDTAQPEDPSLEDPSGRYCRCDRRRGTRAGRAEKQWKFSPADLRERLLWDDYQDAYEDAINCCSTKDAPWYVVPANHKWARNLAVIETVLEVLKKMKPRYPTLSFDPKAVTVQ